MTATLKIDYQQACAFVVESSNELHILIGYKHFCTCSTISL